MSLLFPTHCILCGQTIPEQARGLCKACRAQIEAEMRTLTCYPPEYVSDLVCAAQYRGSYRAALLHIKYAHEPHRLYPIAELMAQAWEMHEMPLPDVITCVPMHGWHKFRRGFNQSEEFAKDLSEMWGVPYVPMLKRKLCSHKQARLSAAQRQENAARSFVRRKDVGELAGQRILLIDDIVHNRRYGQPLRAIAAREKAGENLGSCRGKSLNICRTKNKHPVYLCIPDRHIL